MNFRVYRTRKKLLLIYYHYLETGEISIHLPKPLMSLHTSTKYLGISLFSKNFSLLFAVVSAFHPK